MLISYLLFSGVKMRQHDWEGYLSRFSEISGCGGRFMLFSCYLRKIWEVLASTIRTRHGQACCLWSAVAWVGHLVSSLLAVIELVLVIGMPQFPLCCRNSNRLINVVRVDVLCVAVILPCQQCIAKRILQARTSHMISLQSVWWELSVSVYILSRDAYQVSHGN